MILYDFYALSHLTISEHYSIIVHAILLLEIWCDYHTINWCELPVTGGHTNFQCEDHSKHNGVISLFDRSDLHSVMGVNKMHHHAL